MAENIKASQNKAQAVETPDYQPSIDYIDRLMQKAPASRQEHQMGSQALLQLAQAIQGLKELPVLRKQIANFRSQAGTADRKIAKLTKQLAKQKGK